ncbi:aldose 1-epimerase [Phenylobacterium aquaticum]|uniref:aldose 1-epimerase n=2 Tax=Phenylobacterium aquaticum TaxID=1763816 RepID=UPI0026EB7024|nr:aldose 1-epimerase [Phenylobacterium aquaticum]
MDSVIRLERGDFACTVRPGLGGALTGFTWRGVPLLRPTPIDARTVTDCACFPLVPFANRIARGRFSFQDIDVRLPVPPGDGPHALHGHGWRAAWDMVDHGQDQAILDHHHTTDAWPWPYEAVQGVDLVEGGLDLSLSLWSRGEAPMPFSLGLHPYFPRTGATRLNLNVDGVWRTDAEALALEWIEDGPEMDWLTHGRLPATLVDHCYGPWDGRAVIETPEGRLTLTSDAGWLQVYAPPGADFFCLEPVTHPPDAFNRADGAGVLAPGGLQVLNMELRFEPG